MTQKRRQHTMHFKFNVALEAAKEAKTVNQIAGEHGLHPNQVSSWKKELLTEGPALFGRKNSRSDAQQATQETASYEQIGRLKMELEWLKKKLPPSPDERRQMIEAGHPDLSIRQQCRLIGLNRSTYYWQPATESSLNLALDAAD